MISYYSFFGVNDDTVTLAPPEAMQFGQSRFATQAIAHNSTILGVFMSHEPVIPPMLGSVLCPSWHLQACHLVFSLSLSLSCHFLFPTTSTHPYVLGTTCTQSVVHGLYTILRMIPPCSKSFSSPCIY